MHKTNAMRILDKAKVKYVPVAYEHQKEEPVDAVSVAEKLQEPMEQVYKTLVCQAGHDHLVFVIPGAAELDMKKAAKAAGVKAVSLLPLKDLTKVTGYVRGGCSPFGMKKAFPTFVDGHVLEQAQVYVSGGQIGLQVRMAPADLVQAGFMTVSDLIREE